MPIDYFTLNLLISDNRIFLVDFGNALVKDGRFQIDPGLSYIGEPEYDCDYIVSCEKRAELPDAPLLCYIPAYRTAFDGAEVFAETLSPYFSRTYNHFCGHKNTPQDENSKRYPAIAKKGNIVYIAHPLTAQYYRHGAVYHKRYFSFALNLIYNRKTETEGLGSLGRYTVISQKDKNRYCVNMTYACPTKRGNAEIIEDIPTVYNVKFAFTTDKKIKEVYLPLENKKLDFVYDGGKVKFTVPELNCHTVAVISYE